MRRWLKPPPMKHRASDQIDPTRTGGEMTVDAVMDSPDRVAEVIRIAASYGFTGFGGDCFAAAIAINRVLFCGKGAIVAGLNKSFFEKGLIIGHMAVAVRGIDAESDGELVFWDADARQKSTDEIESWGMLDKYDPDYIELAQSLDFELGDTEALDVTMIEFDDESEVFELVQGSEQRAAQLEEILRDAAALLDQRADGATCECHDRA